MFDRNAHVIRSIIAWHNFRHVLLGSHQLFMLNAIGRKPNGDNQKLKTTNCFSLYSVSFSFLLLANKIHVHKLFFGCAYRMTLIPEFKLYLLLNHLYGNIDSLIKFSSSDF